MYIFINFILFKVEVEIENQSAEELCSKFCEPRWLLIGQGLRFKIYTYKLWSHNWVESKNIHIYEIVYIMINIINRFDKQKRQREKHKHASTNGYTSHAYMLVFMLLHLLKCFPCCSDLSLCMYVCTLLQWIPLKGFRPLFVFS